MCRAAPKRPRGLPARSPRRLCGRGGTGSKTRGLVRTRPGSPRLAGRRNPNSLSTRSPGRKTRHVQKQCFKKINNNKKILFWFPLFRFLGVCLSHFFAILQSFCERRAMELCCSRPLRVHFEFAPKWALVTRVWEQVPGPA